MHDNSTTIQDLKNKIAQFTKEREWEKFHSSKNLSMAIAVEAAELMEKFQWLDEQESKKKLSQDRVEIENEIADIASYILSFCNVNNIDLSRAIDNKMKLNAQKYPIEKSKGKSDKYNKL